MLLSKLKNIFKVLFLIISYRRVSEALIFGSWMLGQALAYAPNINSAVISAGRIIELFNRVPKIEINAPNPYNSADVSSYFYAFQLTELKLFLED